MRVVALLLASVALMGCGMLPSAPPDWVANREELPSCGAEDAGHRTYDAAARTCLLDAYRAGQAAELISTELTIEGDPITRYLRVHPDATIEIFVDSTRDTFGSGGWERVICEDLIPVAEINDPPDIFYPEEMMFLEELCVAVPVG